MISQSAKNCIITGWSPVNPYCLSGCLCCSSKSIKHVLAKDVPILTLRCNSRATALWTVWHAVRCMATSSQALNSAYIAIKCISNHLWPLSSMKSSNGLLHRGNTRHQSLIRIDNKTNMIFLNFPNSLTLHEQTMLYFVSLMFPEMYQLRCSMHCYWRYIKV